MSSDKNGEEIFEPLAENNALLAILKPWGVEKS